MVQFRIHNDNSFLQSIATKHVGPDGNFSPLPPLFKLVQETEDIAEALGHFFCVPVQQWQALTDQDSLESGNSFNGYALRILR